MRVKIILLWLIFGVITFFLFSGCGDLEPELQDTRTVILKMDFNQRSFSRGDRGGGCTGDFRYSAAFKLGEMDSENLRNRSPDLQRVRGANADHRLHHRSAWSSEDPWTHRGTDLACATPDANRSRSLLQWLRRYELPIPWSSLVSRSSRVRPLNAVRGSACSAALFVVSQSHQKPWRYLPKRNGTKNQTP